MEDLDEYLHRARTLDRVGFIMAYRNLFLLKHPKPKGVLPPAWTRNLDGTTAARELAFDPASDRMQIVVIRKKAGNPEPRHFTIGRAMSCDVVLRFPSVSKVHALLTLEASGTITIVDNGSSNRTLRNGIPLLSKRQEILQLGDALSFGGLEFELCDAERLHRLLVSHTSA